MFNFQNNHSKTPLWAWIAAVLLIASLTVVVDRKKPIHENQSHHSFIEEGFIYA